MALILGSRDGDFVGSKAMQELVADLDRMIADQAAYMMPEQHRSLINGISQSLLEEQEWEQKFTAQLNDALSTIEKATDIASLQQLYRSALDSATTYFTRRQSVLSMHQFCSKSRDIIIRWAIRSELAISGESPAPFAICALGNYGRQETTFSSRCDLLLVYGNSDVSAEQWFSAFAGKVSAILDQLELSTDFMRLDDPEWCGDIGVWRGRIASQAGTPDPSSETVSLCDLRPVFGNHELAQELRSAAIRSLNSDQLNLMAALRSASIMPVGFNFFGRLRMERSGSHRGEFNLVQFALNPMVVTIRMMAIQKSISETATSDRISKLLAAGELGVDLAAKLLKAYHDFHRIKLSAEVAHKGNEQDGFYLEREEISHDDEVCLKQGLDALFNLQRIVYQNVEG
jgi:signal-transduction protein with cAMP-binding, CBS, and nucleotidyltransferase domain